MRRTFCFSRSCRPEPPIFLARSLPCCPGGKLRFSMAHFSLWQRSPLRSSFMPSRRHCRQTGPIYLAKLLSPYLFEFRCGLRPWQAFVPLNNRSLTLTAPIAAQAAYTLRFLGGRHPLCGMGVTSLMARTSIPAVLNARTADSRPEPGPETRTSTTRSPLSLALLAAVMAACWAAKGVPLREPRKPSEPALDQEIVLPS